MSVTLRVLTGARAGLEQTFDKPVVTVGRHPMCDLRFDPDADRDVSARHAEIRARGDEWILRDSGSTNGTFVDGARVSERALRDGDVVAFGEHGPTVAIRGLAPARASTAERIAVAVDARTRGLARLLGAFAMLAIAAVAGAWWVARRDEARRGEEVRRLLHRSDSLDATFEREMARLAGTVAALEGARDTTLRSLDGGAIVRTNAGAVALLAVQMPDGRSYTGTAFSVTPAGLLVTNRHLVRDDEGREARLLLVKFTGTSRWTPARVARIAGEDDLALLQVEGRGPFPAVAGIARSPSEVGAPLAILGYPLGTDAPMDGSGGDDFVASATLGVGTASKVLAEVLQIDATAGAGSSGSPVFDRRGRVAGVVFGGARESLGRIVYAIPATRLLALVPPEARR